MKHSLSLALILAMCLFSFSQIGCGQCNSSQKTKDDFKTTFSKSPKEYGSKGNILQKHEEYETSSKDTLVEKASIEQLLARPEGVRFNTPGMVRYALELPEVISRINWSPLAGLSVSAGKTIFNITSRGQSRWETIAGYGHMVMGIEDEEIVWSPSFKSVFNILRLGRIGWRKEWKIPPVQPTKRAVFLIDASVISRLGANGEELWRVKVDASRTLEGPFQCKGNWVFEGRRGNLSSAVVISDRGIIVEQIELPRDSHLLGASDDCMPIIWDNGDVVMLNSRLQRIWSHTFSSLPVFQKIDGGYLLVVPSAHDPIFVFVLSKNGDVLKSTRLPVSGRVTSADFYGDLLSAQMIGICLDVSSPCAKPDGNRGPYNFIVFFENNNFSVLERNVAGNAGISTFEEHGFVVATSSNDDVAVLTFRNKNGQIEWETALPGRLSAGPFSGPYGGVYVGTCETWQCKAPYRFFSVTALSR